MEKLKIFFQNRLNLEVFLAITLLVIASIFGLIVELIIYLLYFMIFLEIVRVLIGFIYEKRVRIRLLIDIFIILALREFIVNVVKINNEDFNSIFNVFSSSTNYHILIFSGVLVFLFVLRFLAKVTSPDEYFNKN
ncbi:hypothetical protein PJV90_09055 [Aliarcobacter butzleri]|uniref:hypothetical protein n=1 Tax=Aliarcobacter butzleri TaxID=28197 RepID=UPI001260863B|nr:hypothetical protein [Aliarcobacter butzleri]MDN5128480.1 hypothetical protein [Aliarcobacter butzleri]